MKVNNMDLNDLFKVVAEGKKQAQEKEPEIKIEAVSLADLFKVVAEGKAEAQNNPIIVSVKENVKNDLAELFNELETATKQVEILEKKPVKKIKYKQKELVKEADTSAVDKLFGKAQKKFEVAANQLTLESLKQKIVLLENAITRLASHGPGSGEVKLRFMDDIDRNSIGDNKYLKYNAASKKFEFAEVGTTIPEEEMPYSKRIDFISDNELYKGEAVVGAAESAALWRIRKVTIGNDGDVTEIYADGNSNFDNVWSDHLTLTYI